MEYDDYMEGELFEEDFAENDQLEQSESIPTEEHGNLFLGMFNKFYIYRRE